MKLARMTSIILVGWDNAEKQCRGQRKLGAKQFH
jgi:hypothetical protein